MKTAVAVLLMLVAVTAWAADSQFTDVSNEKLVSLKHTAADVAQATETSTDAVADFWANHEVKLAAFKSVNDLTSLGFGLSVELWPLTPTNSAWLDAAPTFDLDTKVLSGLVGLSTEISGVPLLAQIAAPLQQLSGDTLTRIGFGWYNGWMSYVTIDF